jgi:hypothetical protein
MILPLSDYMKRDKYEASVVDEIDVKPCINNDALELNSDELDIEKKYHFTVNREPLSVYKLAGEPYIHVLMKVLAYSIYKPLYSTLQLDPHLYRKYKADLLALDYTNEPLCWLECFERDYTKIEYICKHIHVEEFILFEICDDIKPFLKELKHRIHYKYHHLLTVINFEPEVIHYIDPQEVVLIPDWYTVMELQEN